MSEESGDQSIQAKDTQQSKSAKKTDSKIDDIADDVGSDVERKLSDLAAENKKYRQSYAKYKTELDQTRDQLRQMQEQTLQEQGKFKDLYEKTNKDLADERSKRNNDRAQWTGHVVASRFAAEAVKLGCQDPMALVKIANADGLLSKPDLISEDSFEVNKETLMSIVQDAKKANPILFARPTPGMRDGAPSTTTTSKVTKPDLGSMPMDQLLKLTEKFN